jgi:hypothetical protein
MGVTLMSDTGGGAVFFSISNSFFGYGVLAGKDRNRHPSQKFNSLISSYLAAEARWLRFKK